MMSRVIETSFVLLLLSGKATSRSWKGIPLIHSMDTPAEYLATGRTEVDPYHYVPPPTPSNSNNTPAGTSTESRPCPGCADISFLTSEELYPTNEVPLNPPRDYFNYDISTDAEHGPGNPTYYQYGNEYRIRYMNNEWANVQKSGNFDYYWDEFSSNGFGAYKSVLANHNMDQSVCASGNIQSPIDIRLSGVACVETHQVRHRVSFPIDWLYQ
jgi:hypothetical protein